MDFEGNRQNTACISYIFNIGEQNFEIREFYEFSMLKFDLKNGDFVSLKTISEGSTIVEAIYNHTKKCCYPDPKQEAWNFGKLMLIIVTLLLVIPHILFDKSEYRLDIIISVVILFFGFASSFLFSLKIYKKKKKLIEKLKSEKLVDSKNVS